MRPISLHAPTPTTSEPRAISAELRHAQAEIARLQDELRCANFQIEAALQLARDARIEARTDPLTGLPNRRALMEEVNRRALTRTPCWLVMLDLDGFKLINDTLGHDAGDIVLATTARRLTEAVGWGNYVARLAGDEFTLVIDGTLDMALSITRACLANVSKPQTDLGLDVSVGTSAGIAQYEPGHTPNQILQRADVALYATKNNGRGYVTTWTPQMPDGIKPRTPQMPDDIKQSSTPRSLTTSERRRVRGAGGDLRRAVRS